MNLRNVLDNAVKAIHASEKFPVARLLKKIAAVIENDPTDYPLITMGKFLNAQKSALISRAELVNAAEKLNASGSKLKLVLAEELGQTDQRLQSKKVEASRGSVEEHISKLGDPVLKRALQSSLSPEKPYKIYSEVMATGALKVARAELLGAGFDPHHSEIFAGNTDVIVVHASYTTPKGVAHVLVPVVLNEGNPMFPDMFLSTAGFVDLNQENLKAHIVDVAGKPQRVNGQKLLAAFGAIKHGNISKKSAVELAVAKMKLASGLDAGPNAMLGLRMESEVEPIALPVVENVPEEMQSIASRVTSKEGLSKLSLGSQTVEAGRNAILRKMANCGYKSPQISVLSFGDNNITYAVKVAHAQVVKVPVEIKNKLVMEPTVVIASGEIRQFNKEGIAELLSETAPDRRVLAAVSGCSGLTENELFERVRQASLERNIEKAEDAINVLSTKNPMAAKVASQMLIAAINGKKEVVKKVEKPMPVSFMTAKVFFPEER